MHSRSVHQSESEARRRPWSIKRQLMLTVNSVLLVGVVLLLLLDYRYETRRQVMQKHAFLEDEAIAMLPSVLVIRRQNPALLQDYIDDVCARMGEQSSPGHHIAVRLDDGVIQAQSHHRASPAFFKAMRRGALSPDGQARIVDTRIVAAMAREGETEVYVSEYVSDVLAAVRTQIAARSMALAILGGLGTLLVNVILVRQFARPVRRLVEAVRRIGEGERGAQVHIDSCAEFAFLAGEINSMSVALDRAHRERDFQLEKARQLQSYLHPDHPQVEGLSLSSRYEPATEVGGDFYDVLRVSPGEWILCVGDVAGHGVAAAMGAAMLKTILAAAVETTNEPPELLARVNRCYKEVSLVGEFATLMLARWSPATRQLEYASAGHESCYVANRHGGMVELASSGPLLGVLEGVSWGGFSIELNEGDILVLLTDGVTEVRSADGRLFGREALGELIESAGNVSAEQLRDRIEAAMVRHAGSRPLKDDYTLIVAEAV